MRNLFLSLGFLALLFTSCEKNKEVEQQLQTDEMKEILAEAQELSSMHDYYVNEILYNIDETVLQKAKGQVDGERIAMEAVFDAIEAVAGVRPVVMDEYASIEGISKVKTLNDLPVYNFDKEIRMIDYNASVNIESYYDEVDNIILDETTGVEKKISELDKLQLRVLSNKTLSFTDWENFSNTVEILKGSMNLWNLYGEDAINFGSDSGMMFSKSITKWSFFKKLAFVAAADAVGAILGHFVGSYLVVNNVPIYIPAGPQGSVVGLATLSVIAAKMVGW